MQTSPSDTTEDTSEENGGIFLLTPFEVESRVSSDSQIIRHSKNSATNDMQSLYNQKIQCENRVSNSDSSLMIIETQEQGFNSVKDQGWPTENSLTQHDAFDGYLRMMEMRGLKFELPVSSVLRATKFWPFRKKLCLPIRFGVTLMTGTHMRGFWFATVSFFLAFLGWFSIAPLIVIIRKDLGICDNQDDIKDGTKCICIEGCGRTIGSLKVASLISTTVMRLLVGGILETFGPKNVQCILLASGAVFVASVSLIQDISGLIIVGVLIGTVGASFVTIQF